MKILTFSTLYPNAAQLHHGVFVENRLRHLLGEGTVESRVVAPIPWFPFAGSKFGGYGAFARAPRAEQRHGIAMTHPRYPVMPKVGMTIAPLLLYAWSRQNVGALLHEGYDFELIDAHYFYPDGVAAALLGREFGRPVTITARGTDINLISQHRLPRQMILWAAREADGIITVCQALKDALVELGADGGKIRALRNGVDLQLFQPGDRESARRRFGVDGRTVVSVGHLIPRKGHDLVIGALPEIPGVRLLIAGEGPEEGNLRRLAEKLGVADRVGMLGRLAHEDLPDLYGAADALVLASSREGWANVLLEAMACGTPVAASDIWGTPEVVAAPEAGVLIPERTPAHIARAVTGLLANPPDRSATRAYAEGFSWEATTRGQIELFTEILNRRKAAKPATIKN